jgi:hypothetical protein
MDVGEHRLGWSNGSSDTLINLSIWLRPAVDVDWSR